MRRKRRWMDAERGKKGMRYIKDTAVSLHIETGDPLFFTHSDKALTESQITSVVPQLQQNKWIRCFHAFMLSPFLLSPLTHNQPLPVWIITCVKKLWEIRVLSCFGPKQINWTRSLHLIPKHFHPSQYACIILLPHPTNGSQQWPTLIRGFTDSRKQQGSFFQGL